MTNDSTWLVALIVAVVVIGLGIAAVIVAVALPLLSRNAAADMRNHEERVKASNDRFIQELRNVFEDARDENRELRHDVQDVLSELRRVRQGLQRLHDRKGTGQGSGTDVEQDIKRALLNVERTMEVLRRSRPLRSRSLSGRVDEILRELSEIQERLDGASTPSETQGQAAGAEPVESTAGTDEPAAVAESEESPTGAEGPAAVAEPVESPTGAEGPAAREEPEVVTDSEAPPPDSASR